MEAAAPAALALCISLDAVSSLGLVLMSYQGPFVAAMLPLTANVRLNIAAGKANAPSVAPPSLPRPCTACTLHFHQHMCVCLPPSLLLAPCTSTNTCAGCLDSTAAGLGDLLLLTLLRGCLVMLPLFGLSATLPWLAAAGTTVAALTGWLVTKAVLVSQLAAGDKSYLVEQTGVTLHLPTLLAAEVLGIAMAWFLLGLVYFNRRVIAQPAAGDPIIALHTRSAAALQEQRMAVQDWVSQQEPAGVGPELTAPLLAAAATAAEAGEAGPSGVGVPASFASAQSAATPAPCVDGPLAVAAADASVQ